MANLLNILQQSLPETVGSLLALLFVSLITVHYLRQRRLKAIYEIPRKKSRSLKPIDISLRPHNPYYFTRNEDKRIRECVEKGTCWTPSPWRMP